MDMKVLITTTTRRGGVWSYVQTLKRHLAVQADVFAVGSGDRAEGRLRALLRVVRDSLHFYHRTRTGCWDIVHLNPSLGWKAVLRDGVLLRIAEHRRMKTVVFFHGWNKNFEGNLRGCRLWLFKHIYFQADGMVVLAKEFHDRLRTWGYSGPIYVETTAFADEFLGDFANENRMSKPCRDIHLLFLARLERTKGIYEAIDAFTLLKKKYPNLKLSVVGDGPELEASREHTREAKIPDVEFPGYLQGQQKIDAFRRADVYVFPSSYGEGMPISVLEAMASGLPVVTRPVGGLKDFFTDGVMGFMTASTDPRVFAERIERLIEEPDLRRRIGRYNYAYAREHFTASSVARKIESVYRETLERRRCDEGVRDVLHEMPSRQWWLQPSPDRNRRSSHAL